MDKQIVDILASCPYCLQSLYDVGDAYSLFCGHYVCRDCMAKLKNCVCAFDGIATSAAALVQLRPWLAQHMQYYLGDNCALWQNLASYLKQHNANRPCFLPQCGGHNCLFDHTGRFRNLGLCPLGITCKRPQTCAFQHIAHANEFRTGGVQLAGVAASASDRGISLPVGTTQTSPRSHPTLPAVPKPGIQTDDAFYCEQTMVKPQGRLS